MRINLSIKDWSKLYFILIFGILLPALVIMVVVAIGEPFLFITLVFLLLPILLFSIVKLCELLEEVTKNE